MPVNELLIICGFIIIGSAVYSCKTLKEGKMAHVFISYVRENSNVVERLRNILEEHGFDVWLDKYDIMPGERWEDAMSFGSRNRLLLDSLTK